MPMQDARQSSLAEALGLGRASSWDQAAQRAVEWFVSRGADSVAVWRRRGLELVRLAEPDAGSASGSFEDKTGAVERALRTLLPAQGDGVHAAPLLAQEEGLGVIALRGADTLADELNLAGELLGVLARAFEAGPQLSGSGASETPSEGDEVDATEEFGIVGRSPVLKSALEQARLVADTNSTVLILGESGTGKERVAELIHRSSPRRDGPFVITNCATIPATLFESEFFGHVRGAFTGAHQNRDGRFAAADSGTLFLDEVAEIPLELQAKLLRVLQEGTFERVGDTRTQRVDVRVVAATHRDLLQLASEGKFREDLYYRLSVFPVMLPPLRDRGDDVALLAERFLARAALRHGRSSPELTDAARAALLGHRWPGNVRELINVTERALITSTSGVVDAPNLVLPTSQGGQPAPAAAAPPSATGPTRVLTYDELRDQERTNLELALERAGGQVGGAGGAAELVGIPASTFSSKLKAFGLRARTRGGKA